MRLLEFFCLTSCKNKHTIIGLLVDSLWLPSGLFGKHPVLSDDNSKFDRLALGWFIVVVTQQTREQTHKQDASWSLTVLRNVTYRLAKHLVANTEQNLAPQAQPVCVMIPYHHLKHAVTIQAFWFCG